MNEAFLHKAFRELVGKAPSGVARVRGGDINEAYRVETPEGVYFCKARKDGGAAEGRAMFTAESDGLNALRAHFPRVPAVIGAGAWEGMACLVLEWIDDGPPRPDAWSRFGEALARMHHATGPFGFETPSYIGPLLQDNTPAASWGEYYVERRLLPLVRQGVDRGLFNTSMLDKTRLLQAHIPEARPALLHGDLWSGNTKTGPDGDIWIFDPAVYRGHSEMDLAMTRLFGGFPRAFYEAYGVDPEFEDRVALYQLYPLLVHALLFGGGYVAECKALVDSYANIP